MDLHIERLIHNHKGELRRALHCVRNDIERHWQQPQKADPPNYVDAFWRHLQGKSPHDYVTSKSTPSDKSINSMAGKQLVNRASEEFARARCIAPPAL